MLTLVSDIGGAAGLIAGVSMALVCGVLGESQTHVYNTICIFAHV